MFTLSEDALEGYFSALCTYKLDITLDLTIDTGNSQTFPSKAEKLTYQPQL